VQSGSKIRKRKRGADADDDLETRYLQRLSRTAHAGFGPHDEASSGTIPPPSTETGDEKTPFATHESGPHEILHETLSKESTQTDVEKASRTVFLSNVSIDAVVSRKAKRALLNHLSSFLDDTASPPQTVVSLRFRSVPFSTAAMPKRAAFITKAVMQATTRSTNAYAVYSTASAARLAVTTLNGSVILDRHLRADSVAHPASTDHRRCVFVGNLGFVDDETVMGPKTNQEGETVVEKRKRTKVPMDVEEGLWRTFGRHGGKVESVRVIRDEITRVGKGIAYVQFYVRSPVMLSENWTAHQPRRMPTPWRQRSSSRGSLFLRCYRVSYASAGAKHLTKRREQWSGRTAGTNFPLLDPAAPDVHRNERQMVAARPDGRPSFSVEPPRRVETSTLA